MKEELFNKILLTILGLGFTGVISILGFFSARLVKQQDENTKLLAKQGVHIGTLDVRVRHLEERRS